jgi:hypothetical protein
VAEPHEVSQQLDSTSDEEAVTDDEAARHPNPPSQPMPEVTT